MKNSVFQRLEKPVRQRLADQITRQIKKLIFSRKIQVGEKLPTERELAESLNVSRVVVREALRSLEQSGIIEIRPGHSGGSYVSNKIYKPLLDSIYDLLEDGEISLHHFYQAREAIECFNAQRAMESLTPENLEELTKINERLKKNLTGKNTFHKNNMAFHMKLAHLSGNPLFKLFVAALLNLLKIMLPEPSQSAEFIRATYERHQKIISAMRAGDVHEVHQLVAEDTSFTAKLSGRFGMQLRDPGTWED